MAFVVVVAQEPSKQSAQYWEIAIIWRSKSPSSSFFTSSLHEAGGGIDSNIWQTAGWSEQSRADNLPLIQFVLFSVLCAITEKKVGWSEQSRHPPFYSICTAFWPVCYYKVADWSEQSRQSPSYSICTVLRSVCYYKVTDLLVRTDILLLFQFNSLKQGTSWYSWSDQTTPPHSICTVLCCVI